MLLILFSIQMEQEVCFHMSKNDATDTDKKEILSENILSNVKKEN